MPITADLTARAEYLYTDLGTLGVDFTSTDPVAYSAAFHSIRLGAGFRF
jgi:opacity protein-like surface antigen